MNRETGLPIPPGTPPSLKKPGGWSRMRATKCLLLLAALCSIPFLPSRATSADPAEKKNSCVECHSQMEGELAKQVPLVKADVHGARGLSCADCHGGDASRDDMAAAMDPAKGFIGRPAPKDIPALCGSCHSNAELMKQFAPALRIDQEREYLTSVHGQRLKKGDQKVATCVSCHGTHGIRAINDPLAAVYPLNVAETCAKCHAKADYMKDYPIASDQYDTYKTSAHAQALYGRQDLSAPTCNDCHGNHGAAPPGIASIVNVCGQCHVRQSDLFAKSPHKSAFDAMGLGDCVACHSNHGIRQPNDEMVGVGEKSVCSTCHATPEDQGYRTAQQMRAQIDGLAVSLNGAADILGKAERAGMEVSRPKFDLNEARDALTHARVLIHAFSTDEVDKVIQPGLEIAAKSQRAGEAALHEWGYRRKGLAASLFFILFLAILVYLKVRQMEARQRNANG